MLKLFRFMVLGSLTLTVSAVPQVVSSSSIVERQTVVTDLPALWSFFGCFQDSTSARSLSGATFTNTTGMTIEACVNFCNSRSFIYAGLEFGQECYCDVVFENAEVSAPNTDCSQACTGNPAQLCGAPNRLSVYTSNTPAIIPSEVQSVGDWVALGCFSDSVSSRTLQMRVNVVGGLTVESCTTACFANGFTLSGVEFGQECWCGSQILNGGTFVGNSNGISGNPPVRSSAGGPFCDTACVGDNTELCGGSDRMNLYNFTGSTAPTALPSLGNFLLLGCFPNINPTNDEPILLEQIFPNGVTEDTCTAACMGEGFFLAGVGAGSNCFCDFSTIQGNPSPLPDSQCNVPCTANNFEICGGASTMNIYQFQNVGAVLSAFKSLTAPTNNLVALINSVTASNVQTVGPEIVSSIQALVSLISGADSSASSAINVNGRAFLPLTGAFASQANDAMEGFGTGVEKVFGALGSQSTILKPAFDSSIASGIQNLMTAAVNFARDCASTIMPSFSESALSLQTDLERTSAQAAAMY